MLSVWHHGILLSVVLTEETMSESLLWMEPSNLAQCLPPTAPDFNYFKCNDRRWLAKEQVKSPAFCVVFESVLGVAHNTTQCHIGATSATP